MIAKNKQKRSRFKLILLILSATGLFLFLRYVFLIDRMMADKVYPNVFLDNYDSGDKTKAELSQIFAERKKLLEKVNLSVFYDNEPIATFSAQKLKLNSNRDALIERAYRIGRNERLLNRFSERAVTLFKIGRYNFSSQIDYDKSVLNEFINTAEDQYNKPAKNALFKFENNRVVTFRGEEKGLKILSDDLLYQTDQKIQKLKNSPNDIKVEIRTVPIEPEISLAKINQFGVEELIGEGRSNFSHSIPERIHNLTLASSKFNGVLIPPNKLFSFNETVGDISSLTGYKPAYIIKEGRTVLGDGGGVCQVSTTFFRAALNTGLPIIERHAHAYRVSYYENDSGPGFDATVFAPSVDLKILNDMANYILIQTEVDQENMLLYFRFYGKKDGRRAEISAVSVYDVVGWPPPVYQDDPTLKRGVSRQIDFPAGGAKASFNYKIIKPTGDVVEKTFFSAYRPWSAVFLVGTAD